MYKFVKSKRKTKKSIGLLTYVEGNLITNETEEAKVLNTSFTSAFMNRVNYPMMRMVRSKDRVGDKQPRVVEEQVRDHLGEARCFQVNNARKYAC